ncbi:MAG: glycoside hydrolase/phage tail family protein [Anaplasma sp.]
MSSSIFSTAVNAIGDSVLKYMTKNIEEMLGHSTGGASITEKPIIGKQSSLQEIKIQTSTYGKMIPEVYGTTRISGNIIWALPVKFTEHRRAHVADSQSPAKYVTTKNYYATLAIAICSGPTCKHIQVWANGRLLDLNKIRHRFYMGTETQEPDPLILSVEDSAPSYRGTAYMVIEDLPLLDYNNAIPNFVFEVTAYPEGFFENHVVQKIDSVHIIAHGEFGYDTKTQTAAHTETVGEITVTYGMAKKINGENGHQKSHAMESLELIEGTLLNLKWVAITVNWFASDINIEHCSVLPGITYGREMQTFPDTWTVGNFTAQNSYRIPQENGVSQYAGTANDASLVRYIQELKSRGYKVLLSVKLVAPTEGGQWVCENAGNISTFFGVRYHPFMEHYCHLTKGAIDAFCIGSGFGSLTKIQDGVAFPAVEALIELAQHAKAILGNEVTVTYAANWDEYHSHNGTYNMDALWSSSAVDVVGINAYFPLTDAQTPTNDAPRVQDIVQSWKSGEGYNYFYKDPLSGQSKTTYTSARFAWKNMYYWWSHRHINSHDKSRTPWKPKSKQIWFIEYGFRSVENCTHSPMSLQQSTLPENVDFAAQKTAIAGTIRAWKSSKMVRRMFLYAWNIKPHTNTTAREYRRWHTGYWINGKIELVTLTAIIRDILNKIGAPSRNLRGIDEPIFGYSIHNHLPARAIIRELQKIYFFDLIEKEGLLAIVDNNAKIALSIPQQDIVPKSCKITRLAEVLHGASALLYISKQRNYQPNLRQILCRNKLKTRDILQTSLVLDGQQAESILDGIYYTAMGSNYFYKMAVPIKYSVLNAGDVVSMVGKPSLRTIRLTSVKILGPKVYLEGFSHVSTRINNGIFPAD